MNAICKFRINGTEHSADVETMDTVLTIFRERFGLLGAKRGCDQGVCGACTVLMDGRPVRACLSLAVNCEGSEFTTVEAMSTDAIGQSLQKAFLDLGAVQCGFCTSGMLLAACALLRENSDPNIEQVREALSGNLCRCSGYRKIVDAVIDAARETHR